MNRLQLSLITLLALIAVGPPAAAEETTPDRILITIADPGMSNAARSGPTRPGYGRRSSPYLVSVKVRRAADRVAAAFDLQVVDEWPIVPLQVHCLVYEVAQGTELDALLDLLRARPEVESAQRLNQFKVSGTAHDELTDTYASLQHNLDTLELVKAHTWSQGAGSRITIIDTGADVAHPDLKSQIRDYHDFVADSHGEFSHDAHGTAVAGIIGAASDNGFGITGIAPAAGITVLRACWYTQQRTLAVCDSFTLAKALTHALESRTDIINLSLGGPADELLARLVNIAQERGIVVVAAAPPPQHPGFPANVPGVIVVDSWPAADALQAGLSAPGEEILVAVPGGGFDYASGTSLSAAHVSGIVALLVAERPALGRDVVIQILVASQDGDGGSVNACRALAHLLERTGCRDVATVRNLD